VRIVTIALVGIVAMGTGTVTKGTVGTIAGPRLMEEYTTGVSQEDILIA
jgi:hypothetical protein